MPFASLPTVALCATLSPMALASSGDVKDGDLALCKAITKAKASLSDGIEPRAETFKDVEHVARASEQLTLMNLTSKTLTDIAVRAEKEPFGSPFSITPVLTGRRAYFEVRYLDKGRISEVRYDLLTGDKM